MEKQKIISKMKESQKNPRKTTKGNGDKQTSRKRIQNNDSEDDPRSQKNREDAINVYQRFRTKKQVKMNKLFWLLFSSVQSLSCVWLFVTSWITARQASLSITNSWSSLKLMSIESVMPSSHLILCRPLLLLPPIPPSIRVFSNESTLRMRWPKYWSFSFSISPANEHPGLISFRMDWLEILAVQGTPKSLLQNHSSKASILQHSAFFTVQLSHPYMTTGKTIALTRWTFACKVMSLLFNILSRLVITFLPRSKLLLISRLQSPSAVILEPPKIKSDTVSTVSPSISHEVMGPEAMILVFWMLSFKPTFLLSSFTFNTRLFSSSSLSAIRVVSSAYLRLLIFLLAILVPACASSSPAFLMMYSAYKLNKQGDNIQPWRIPFPIRNQSVVPCPVLTVASWPAYRFLKRQVRWSGILISFRPLRGTPAATDSSEAWPRRATPHPKLGVGPNGATPRPRSGAAA